MAAWKGTLLHRMVISILVVCSCSQTEAASTDRDGQWSLWSFWWPPCEWLDEGAWQNRTRLCNNPAPAGNGLTCPGAVYEKQQCPINGQWGAWEAWQFCNNQCGKGTRTRTRYCVNPEPQFGGKKCPGSYIQSKDCQYWHFKTCPGDCPLCGRNEKCYQDAASDQNFYCDCAPGYARNITSPECEDVNECSLPNSCGENQNCQNKIGSHLCFCKEGYKIDKRTGKCISNYKPDKCHRVVGSYRCACPRQYNDILSGQVSVSHTKIELVQAPNPVVLKSRTYTCTCYYCAKKVELEVKSEYSKCDLVVKSPECTRYVGDENAKNNTFPNIPAVIYDEMNILSAVKVLTLSREAAQNLSNAEFSEILREIADDIMGGALNADKQDSVTGDNMAVMVDADKAATELMDAFKMGFPLKTFDINTLDVESLTTVRLTQASPQAGGTTYDCGDNGGPENNIWLSDAVIVQEKQSVLFTCISDPHRTLAAKMYRYHPPLKGSEEYEALKNATSLPTELNSPVISATTFPRPLKLLPDDRVMIHFKLFQRWRERYHPTCAWYDFKKKMWKLPDIQDDNGCDLIHVNVSYAVCACSHLTNFAVVMKHTPEEPSVLVLKRLDTAVILGCSVALTAVLIALILFLIVGSFPPDRVVHINLALCIACLEITFIAGSTATHDRIACKIVAVILHYLFTCVFTWQLSDVIIYILWEIYKIRAHDGSFHIISFSIGWGLPVLFVTIAVGAEFHAYGSGAHCWVHTDGGVLWAQLIPIMLIVFCVIIALTTLLRHLNLQPYVKDSVWLAKLAYHTKAAMFLLIITCVLWISGAYTMNNDTRVPSYMFAAVNGLMGCVVLVFYCISEPEVAIFFKRKKRDDPKEDLVVNPYDDSDRPASNNSEGAISNFFAIPPSRAGTATPLPALPACDEEEHVWYVRKKKQEADVPESDQVIDNPPITARGVLPEFSDETETVKEKLQTPRPLTQAEYSFVNEDRKRRKNKDRIDDSRDYMGEFIMSPSPRPPKSSKRPILDPYAINRAPSPAGSIDWGVPEQTANVFVLAPGQEDNEVKDNIDEEHGWFARDKNRKKKSGIAYNRTDPRAVSSGADHPAAPTSRENTEIPDDVNDEFPRMNFGEEEPDVRNAEEPKVEFNNFIVNSNLEEMTEEAIFFARTKTKKKDKRSMRKPLDSFQNQAFSDDVEIKKKKKKKKKSKEDVSEIVEDI